MSMQPPSEPVNLFYCYAHEDAELCNQLDKHLSLLQRQGYLVTWHEGDILAGDNRAKKVYTYMDSAQVILLLISSDFLASDYCYIEEMQPALARHATGEARVIPIILRPVDWKIAPTLSSLQPLPVDGRPVTSWPSYDAAFENIAQGICKVVDDLWSGQYKPEQKDRAAKGTANPRLQEQRRVTCLNILISIRVLVQIVTEYRQMHDDLLVRAIMAFNSKRYVKKIKAQFQSIQNKLIVAGSELSLDPDGQGVMDAFVAYLQAQARYIQEMSKPMESPLTFAFGRTDAAVLDAFVAEANEKLSVLEKIAQDFIQSS